MTIVDKFVGRVSLEMSFLPRNLLKLLASYDLFDASRVCLNESS